MEFDHLLDAVSDLDDDELLSRVKAMESQLPQNQISRLSALPSYLSTLQGVLDRCEEKQVHSEGTLDGLRASVQRCRDLVRGDLEHARQAFESLERQLVERGRSDDAEEARRAAGDLAVAQDSQRLRREEMEHLEQLHGRLLSSLFFGGD